MLRLAIAGGNIGASALISLLRGDSNTQLIGIYEKNQDQPGIILARKWNIPVFDDVRSLCAAGPEMVINVAGDVKLSNEIREVSGNRIEVFWSEFLWNHQRKKKRAKIGIQSENRRLFPACCQVREPGRLSGLGLMSKAIELTRPAVV
jgi:hypothetical protein